MAANKTTPTQRLNEKIDELTEKVRLLDILRANDQDLLSYQKTVETGLREESKALRADNAKKVDELNTGLRVCEDRFRSLADEKNRLKGEVSRLRHLVSDLIRFNANGSI